MVELKSQIKALEKGWDDMREKERKYEVASKRMRKDISKKEQRVQQLEIELAQAKQSAEQTWQPEQEGLDDFEEIDVTAQ